MLKFLFKPYWRESLGICIIVFGSPLIFFVRDTLKLLPKGSVTTAGFLVLGAFLMASGKFIRVMYKPNMTLLKLGTGFLGLAFFYYLFFNPYAQYQWYDGFREFSNFAFTFVFIFMLLNVPNEVRNTLVEYISYITFAGSIALIVSLFLNPNYALGQRATIYFGDGEEGGNPHVFAKNGYALLITAFLMLRQNRGLISKLFYYGAAFIAVVTIIITQTRGILLATFLAIAVFMYFNLTKTQIKSFVKTTFTPRNLLGFFVVIYGVYYYLAVYTPVLHLLSSYTERFSGTFLNAFFTILGSPPPENVNASFDASSAQRVLSWVLFTNYFEGQPGVLIFGQGYRFVYLDIPVLEAWLDLGITGFVLFVAFNAVILWECYKAIKYQYNDLTTFLAYYYISFFIGIFSAGRPFDTPYWFFFALLIRFMGIKYLQKNNRVGN